MISEFLRKIVPERFRPIGYLTHLTRTRCARRVISGPFTGMCYIDQSRGSAYIPKLLGIYERELTTCVEEICRLDPKLIVDVGAAEGYYAIGLAMRCPQAKVIAFEMDSTGRQVLDEMAKLNEVSSRVEINGMCEPENLRAALVGADEPVVVCDVEGYEEKLLDLEVVPELEKSRILVELHDFLVPEITSILKTRFNTTHCISHIWQEPRTRADFPWRTIGTRLLPGSYVDWAVSEWRPVRMAWLWMVPK